MKCSALLLFGSLACIVHAAEPATLRLTQTIPLPGVRGRFDHFAIDSAGKHLFLAALGNNTIEVIDLAAGKRIRSLPGMSKPTGILHLPNPSRVIVANGDDGTLKVLSGVDFKVLQNLTALADADNLRFDAQTKLAWLGYGEGALAAVDIPAAKILDRVSLPAHPESFQLEEAGQRIFVNVPDARQIAVIDREKRAVTDTWPMEKFQANFPMALDEPNSRLFVGCRKPARLVVLDTTTGQPVADLAISGDTDDLFHDAARKLLYLSCGEGFVDVIDQRSASLYQLRERIPTRPGARTSFFSKGFNEYYLAVPQQGNEPAELRVFQALN
jgi:DNA-binding beta-propeller fold protein YncE